MDTFLLGVLVEYPYIINRTNNTKRRKICTIMNIAKQRTVPVTPVNVQKNNNVIVSKSFVRNFVMSPIIWFIVIVILMILAW